MKQRDPDQLKKILNSFSDDVAHQAMINYGIIHGEYDTVDSVYEPENFAKRGNEDYYKAKKAVEIIHRAKCYPEDNQLTQREWAILIEVTLPSW